MADKMLIDASHEEETRVVVVRGNRIEEFDFESQHKKQLRGNIYLAKVTRVEPSLQAAFVDYGGNRHGFLAFSEIHPDYYQIPLADREALMREAASDVDDSDDGDTAEPAEAKADTKPKPRTRRGKARTQEKADASAEAEGTDAQSGNETADAGSTEAATAEPAAETTEEAAPKPRRRRKSAKAKAAEESAAESDTSGDGSDDGDDTSGNPTSMAAKVDSDSISEDVDDDDTVESVGAEDAMEEVPEHVHRRVRKQYRIQEVIKRRQILLVQVAKEERGNKGAALTTYLSLAGRYSVLMPNTARGGGISRKITNLADRKRLKEVARGLEVPQGMGVILRTAGANRTKAEVKRDFEYLMRLWENVRTKTLTSTAPCLVYEEGSLIKRSIRDLYNKDINEVIVSGEEGYREAKDFMKMLMPSHAKVVQRYRDVHPIYSRSGIEAQLDRMLQPQVTLKSGGYLIINQTEALVAVDVNSGRSTREHSIEDTALQTNLEAAEEVARQLRLRDLAGLVVVDFIDMEEKRNNRAVEKKLKDCLKNDRARIQVGRISHFGLLEMSRQRIRASVLESTTQVCSHCGGTGHVLSQSSVALHVLRGVEEYLLKNTTHNITVRTTPETALYLLNQKRNTIVDYENRFGLEIIISSDADLVNTHFEIDRGEPVAEPVKIESLFNFIEDDPEDNVEIVEETPDEDEDTSEETTAAAASASSDDQNRSRRKRRRRRGRNGNGQPSADGETTGQADADTDGEEDDDAPQQSETAEATPDGERPSKRKRRRGKRGGRRNRNEAGELQGEAGDGQADDGDDETAENAEAVTSASDTSESVSEAKAPELTVTETADPETAATEEVAAPAATETTGAPSTDVGEDEAMAEIEGRKPRRRRRKPKAETAEESTGNDEVAAAAPSEEEAVVETAAAELDDTPAETAEAAPVEEQAKAEEAPAEEAPKRANRASNVSHSEPVVTSNVAPENDDEPSKPKRGWWQRRGFF